MLKINIAISLSALLFLFNKRKNIKKISTFISGEKKDFGLNCLWKCNNIQTTSFWRVKPIMKCARTKWPFDELSWIAFYLLPQLEVGLSTFLSYVSAFFVVYFLSTYLVKIAFSRGAKTEQKFELWKLIIFLSICLFARKLDALICHDHHAPF